MNQAIQTPSDLDQLIAESEDTNEDPRHQKRIRLIQALFTHSFGQDIELDEPGEHVLAEEIIEAIPSLDDRIQPLAPERPLTDINQVDLAILRLIVFESEQSDTPTKVLINEAVELAKEFGTESSPRFVNGVLGKLLTTE